MDGITEAVEGTRLPWHLWHWQQRLYSRRLFLCQLGNPQFRYGNIYKNIFIKSETIFHYTNKTFDVSNGIRATLLLRKNVALPHDCGRSVLIKPYNNVCSLRDKFHRVTATLEIFRLSRFLYVKKVYLSALSTYHKAISEPPSEI